MKETMCFPFDFVNSLFFYMN